MNFFLPRASDNEPANSKLKAKAMVVRDKDKLEAAGDTSKTLESSGKRGCVQYKMANVIKPPINNARFAR